MTVHISISLCIVLLRHACQKRGLDTSCLLLAKSLALKMCLIWLSGYTNATYTFCKNIYTRKCCLRCLKLRNVYVRFVNCFNNMCVPINTNNFCKGKLDRYPLIQVKNTDVSLQVETRFLLKTLPIMKMLITIFSTELLSNL